MIQINANILARGVNIIYAIMNVIDNYFDTILSDEQVIYYTNGHRSRL